MYNLKISVATLFVLSLVLFLHLYGMAEHMYVRFWFYDIIAHVLGGVGIAMSIYCVALFLKIKSIKGNLGKIVVLTLLAGVAWELFEIFFNITGSRLWSRPYYIDTVKDLINDTIGSVVVCLLIRNK